jgi:hypothetical protein
MRAAGSPCADADATPSSDRIPPVTSRKGCGRGAPRRNRPGRARWGQDGRVRTVTDHERRARLARRHGVRPGDRAPDAESAARAMTVLHATEPATVHLSLHARVDGLAFTDVDRVLYEERSLVKQLAMRRTLFVFPRDLLPSAWGSASSRVAGQEQRRLARDVTLAGLTEDGEGWLRAREGEVLAALADAPGQGLSAAAVRAAVPALDVKASASRAGSRWSDPIPVAPRVLTWLGARAEVVRGRNDGHWRTSRPTWTRMEAWLGAEPDPAPEAEGYAELVRRWLWTFGPGTETDLVWWLGSTRTAARQALADVRAVEVGLEDGGTGWLLPDDLDPVEPPEPWAALLPVLDPTTMGWKERGFYLRPEHAREVFDSAGNAGATAWWDGRVVGAWVQDEGGTVRPALCEDPGREARASLEREADRLTAALDGVVVGSVYRSPLMTAARSR